MEPKYPEGGHCQSGLRPQGFLTSRFKKIIHCRRQRHLTWSATHDVVSQESNLWKSFDLLLESNLWPLAPSAGCLNARPPELTTDADLLVVLFIAIISLWSAQNASELFLINSFHNLIAKWNSASETLLIKLQLHYSSIETNSMIHAAAKILITVMRVKGIIK